MLKLKKLWIISAVLLLSSQVSATPIAESILLSSSYNLTLNYLFDGYPVSTNVQGPTSSVLALSFIDDYYTMEGSGIVTASIPGAYAQANVSEFYKENEALSIPVTGSSYAASTTSFSYLMNVVNLNAIDVSVDFTGTVNLQTDIIDDYARAYLLGKISLWAINGYYSDEDELIYDFAIEDGADYSSTLSKRVHLYHEFDTPYNGELFFSYYSHAIATANYFVPEPNEFTFLLFGICAVLLLYRLVKIRMNNTSKIAV